MNPKKKKCIPCEDDTLKPLTKKQVLGYLLEVPSWKLDTKAKKISRTLLFKDFLNAISFVKKVAILSEREGHHPDIFIFYNKVTLVLWTHSIKGLSENDFILASKINTIKCS